MINMMQDSMQLMKAKPKAMIQLFLLCPLARRNFLNTELCSSLAAGFIIK